MLFPWLQIIYSCVTLFSFLICVWWFLLVLYFWIIFWKHSRFILLWRSLISLSVSYFIWAFFSKLGFIWENEAKLLPRSKRYQLLPSLDIPTSPSYMKNSREKQSKIWTKFINLFSSSIPLCLSMIVTSEWLVLIISASLLSLIYSTPQKIN